MGWSLTKAAEAAEVSEPTARKWVARYLAEGEAGLRPPLGRPPRSQPNPKDRIEAICALRRLRFTGAEISEILGMAETTSLGSSPDRLGRLGRVGLEPARRYERTRPGELVHVDVKKLGRIEGGMGKRITGMRRHYTPTRTDRAGVRRKTVGWGMSTCASTTPIGSPTSRCWATSGQRQRSGFVAPFGSLPATGFRSSVSSPTTATPTAPACTRSPVGRLGSATPFAPVPIDRRTNGKAERFIRTMLGGWAYGAIHRKPAERTAALDGWLWRYNNRRPHGALGRKTPAARLRELNNPLGVLHQEASEPGGQNQYPCSWSWELTRGWRTRDSASCGSRDRR